MAEGIGTTGEQRFQDALDACLVGLRRGDSVDRCLSAYPQLAAHLRPLLHAAALVIAGQHPAPEPASGLVAGKERYQAAIEAARTARQTATISATQWAGSSVSVTAPDSAERSAAAGESGRVLPVTEALDRAVTVALSRDRVNVPVPREIAGLVQPLVALVSWMRADAVVAPPAQLARMRSRFLAVAAALAANLQTVSEDAEQAAAEKDPLESFGLDLVGAGIAPPPPPHQLAVGRDRLLAAAAASRTDGRAASVSAGVTESGFGARYRAFLEAFGTPVRGTRARLVAGAAVVAGLLMGNALVLAPAAAASLPGDALYPVKRFTERVSLAVTLDETARAELREAYSARRATELSLASAAGATAEIEDWEARFVDARLVSDDRAGGEDLGVFRVTSRGANRTVVTTTLAWNARTNFDLGKELADLTKVTANSELQLSVRPRGAVRPALALRIRLTSLAEPLPTPTLPAATETVQPNTPEPSPTDTASPNPSFTPTPLVDPTPTLTPLPTPTTVAAGGDWETPEPAAPRLSGVLMSDPTLVEWDVRELESQTRGRTVKIDASYLIEKGVRDDLAIGHYVYLEGRWADGQRSRFIARRVLESRPNPCQSGNVLGIVAEYEPGTSLTLVDGSRYLIAADAPPRVTGGALVPGVRVEVTYEDCGLDDLFVRAVVVLPEAVPSRVQGVVAEIDILDGQLVLTATTGIADPLTVEFVPGVTPISGASDELEVGQVLEIVGRVIEPGVVVADRIIILQGAPSATPVAPPTLPSFNPGVPIVTATPAIPPPSASEQARLGPPGHSL